MNPNGQRPLTIKIKRRHKSNPITRKKNAAFLIIAVVILFSMIIFTPDAANTISREDGPVENLTTFIFLATAVTGIISTPKQTIGKKAIAAISAVSFLAFLSEISFGERLLELEMPHAGGKQLDGVHDLLHMLQKILIVNYKYHPNETSIVAITLLIASTGFIYTKRKLLGRLNSYLKKLKIRSLLISAIALAALSQLLDLNIIILRNGRLLEEALELAFSLCLALAVLKVKQINSGLPRNG